jgi:putative DNA primase/helicase
MLDAALDYAAKGWPVFPCSPDDKRALIKEWQNVASVDAAQITAWWTKWPKAMIGSLQGANGCFAIDLDILNKDTGEIFEPEDLKAALEEEACALPSTRIATTGSGGWHVYLRIPAGASVPRKIRKLPQIDICGEKGYTILPPSQRADGKAYTWLNSAEIAEAPAALVAWISAKKERDDSQIDSVNNSTTSVHPPPSNGGVDSRTAENRRKYALSALMRVTADLAGTLQGGRNDALNKAAFALGCLVGAGILSESTVRAELVEAASRNGLLKDDGRDAVLKTLNSGLSSGIINPIDLSQIGTRVSSPRMGTSNTSARLGASPSRPQSSSHPPPSEPPKAQTPAPPSDVEEDPGEQQPPDEIDWDLLRLCVAEPLNDIGNSRRLRHRYGEKLIHIQDIGYFAWDNKRWAEDKDFRQSSPMCHKTAEAIVLESLLIEPTAQEKIDIDAAEGAKLMVVDCDQRLSRLFEEGAGSDDKKTREREIKLERDLAREALSAGRAARAKLSARKANRRKYAVSSGNTGKLDGMLKQALSFLSRPMQGMDNDAYALNVNNCTLRFEAMPDKPGRWHVVKHDHRQKDMITKLAEVDYDPEAKAPKFFIFLSEIMPNEDVRGFLQRYFGYCLTALTTEQVFCLFHGEGSNGKSTIVDLMARLLADYSTLIPIATLVNDNRAGKGSEATPDLAKLPGARLVRAAEPREGLSFDESLIKGLTSGEPIPIRRLQKEFIDIYPTFKLIISANRKPTIKGNDDGIWRRVRLVPFEVQFPEGKKDKGLPEKLWAERSGVLNWMIEGALQYFERGGLDAPKEVLAATQEYRDESDVVGSFVRAALDITGQSYDSLETGKIYNAFVVFCKRAGVTPFAMTTFSRRLPKAATQFGFTKGKSSLTVYSGIKLKEGFEPQYNGHHSRGDEHQ